MQLHDLTYQKGILIIFYYYRPKNDLSLFEIYVRLLFTRSIHLLSQARVDSVIQSFHGIVDIY